MESSSKKKITILVSVILCFLLLLLIFILSRSLGETYTVPSFDPTQVITSEQEAVDALRDIGMSIFVNENIKAPNFTAVDLEGNEISLEDFAGKIVFLNFWATWCGPCKIEMPGINQLYVDLKDEDFTVIAINQQENLEMVREFIEREGYSFPVIIDSDGRINYQYGVRGIPSTYIIGGDGNVLAAKVGTHFYEGEYHRSLFRNLK